MAINLTNFYLHVVSDVIHNVRSEFIHEGVDEAVLAELQSLWELNLMQSGVIQAPLGTEPRYTRVGAHVHDLNIPYGGGGETPTAELIFGTPAQTPLSGVQTPIPTFMGPGPSPGDTTDASLSADASVGRPAPYIHASPWVNQNLDVGIDTNTKLDMNIAYEGGDDEGASNPQHPVTQELLPSSTGKRKREDIISSYQSVDYFPQHDGAGDGWDSDKGLEGTENQHRRRQENYCDTIVEPYVPNQHATAMTSIPQVDGNGDHYDDGIAEEDYNELGDEEQYPVDETEFKPKITEGLDSDALEPPLNEEDDLADDFDELDKGDGDSKTENLVLAQFEKVTRTKNKWKCILKDGIMRLRNQEYVFSRANGEFEF